MMTSQQRLLSDISHELRTPLTRLQLGTALLRRRSGDVYKRQPPELFGLGVITETPGLIRSFQSFASFTPAVGLIALLIFGAVVPTNIPLIILCGLFYKFGSGLTLGATTVMLADVIDYGEVKLGTRNESIVASFQTLLVKTASAVAGWLIGVGLTIFGYVENVPQTPGTIMGMRILMGVIPSIVTVLAFVIYVKGYKLDSSAMENITKQLKEKNKVNN